MNKNYSLSRPLTLGALFLLSLSVPWAVQAIFPPSPSRQTAPLPPEEPVYRPIERQTPDLAAQQRAQNQAWISGESTEMAYRPELQKESALDQGVPQDLESLLDQAQDQQDNVPDSSASVFVGYDRSWDTLDITREIWQVGGSLFLGENNRLGLTYREMRFDDPTDSVQGRGATLDMAHRLGENVVLEESVGVNGYEGLHNTVNASARVSGSVTEKLFLSVGAQWLDIWERVATIQNKLQLFSIGPYLYWEFFPRWWIVGQWLYGSYSDDNTRHTLAGELGFWVWQKIGLSISGGVETTHFTKQQSTYWSPAYYRYLFGRLRLSRGFEEPLFPFRWNRTNLWNRLGYLLEYTGGINQDNDLEQSFRAGLSYHITEHWSVRSEFYHLDSQGRFSSHYSENRVDGKIIYKF